MDERRSSAFLLSDRWYNFGKKLVTIILPAFGTFYFALAGIWNLPYADKVTGTVLAVSTFLGVVLGISTAQYNASGRAFDGQVTMQPATDVSPPIVTGLSLGGLTSKDLEGKKSVTLKVAQEIPVGTSEDHDEIEVDEGPPQNPATRRRP